VIVEAAPGVGVLAVRTPTLPPATHTNVYVLGQQERVVVDPASPWPDEQKALLDALDGAGGRVAQILLTHHHHDHVAGAVALRDALAARGRVVPIVAHPTTAQWLHDEITVDRHLDGGAVLGTDDGRRWEAVFTPGHAPGHLVLHDESSGVVVAGDLVAGTGTILIDPSDGDLAQYLDSLAQVQARGPGALLPSHGPVLEAGEQVLAYYIAHRHLRNEQILEALAGRGVVGPDTLVPAVYPDLAPIAHPMAARQIESHLRYLTAQGSVVAAAGGWMAAT